MNPKISILGLLHADSTLFDGMALPEGVDKTRVIDQIVEDCAELEILFTDPDYMKYSIKSWSERRLYSWTKLYETSQYEYNPIWNKDGTVTETESGSNSAERNTSGQASNTGSNSHKVRGYNAASLVESENDSVENSGSSSENVTDEASHTVTRTREEHGNIGVTTTQQMIKEEREISNFDIYQIIADDFKTRYCVMIY
jgi:hypothetical protein